MKVAIECPATSAAHNLNTKTLRINLPVVVFSGATAPCVLFVAANCFLTCSRFLIFCISSFSRATIVQFYRRLAVAIGCKLGG